MTRDEWIEEVEEALANICDYDTGLKDYARVMVDYYLLPLQARAEMTQQSLQATLEHAQRMSDRITQF